MRQSIKGLAFLLCAMLATSAGPADNTSATIFTQKEPFTEKLSPEKLKEHLEKKPQAAHVNEGDGYTVNYKDVDIKEIIRFISKICDLNFSYDDTKLSFNVTMISQGPAHISDIISAFVQLLRIHGLTIVPNDGMLLICEEGQANAPAPLITEMQAFAKFEKTPLATRLYYVDNIGATAAMSLIKPMLSPSAIIEASETTSTLVITDTPANLQILDTYVELLNHPGELSEISLFRVKHHFASALVQIAEKVLGPIAGKTPLLLLPQQNSNAILIISSPFLIKKSIAILTKLDSEPSSYQNATPKGIASENILVYTPKFKSGPELIAALRKIGAEALSDQMMNQDLEQTLASARWIAESGTLLVVGDTTALKKVQSILGEIDVDTSQSPAARTFLVYTPKHLSFSQLDRALESFAKTKSGLDQSDPALIFAICNAYADNETGTFTFSGTRETLSEVSKFLSGIDTAEAVTRFERKFFLYTPKNRSPQEVLSALKQVGSALRDDKVMDPSVEAAISSAKIVSEKQAILIAAPEQTLDQIKALLKNIDTPTNAAPDTGQRYLVYQIKALSESSLIAALDQVAVKFSKTQDPDEDLIRAIKHVKYIPQTHALIFTGQPSTIQHITEILSKLDTGSGDGAPTSFLSYRPQFLSPKALLEQLKAYKERLRQSGLNNPKLLDALGSATLSSSKDGNIVISGNKAVLTDVQEILKSLDSPGGSSERDQFIYKTQHVSPQELLSYLNEAAEHTTGPEHDSLLSAIQSAKIFPAADSIAFTGTKFALTRIKEMVAQLDTTSKHAAPSGLFVYQPKNLSKEELNQSLDQLANQFSEQSDQQPMVCLIETRHWNPQAGAFIFSGSKEAIAKLQELLQTIDNGNQGVGTSVYTLEHVSLEDAMAYINKLAENNPSPEVLAVLKSAKGVQHSHSILFRGPHQAVNTVISLLKQYDAAANAPATAEGKTVFALYHPKYVSGDVLISHLKKMAEDLTHSGLTDTPLIRTLSQVKWNAASKGILLTGTADSVKRAEAMLAQFDIPISQGENKDHSSFWIYHPNFVSIDELAKWVRSTRANLQNSGLSDPGLFAALDSMRVSQGDQSLTFSGPPDALAKIKELVTHYDNEFNTDKQRVKVGGMVFLLYKLQYHQGQEVMKALQNIGGLYRTFAKRDEGSKEGGDHLDQDLIDTISSMQWLSMTNSILCSGSAPALDKIQALIKKIDVPLQQVFLEVLVINTTLTESLNFGIRWGGAGNLFGKATTSLGLFPSNDYSTTEMNSFGSKIQGAVKGTLPAPTVFGTEAFNFGIIGDVISHGKKVYLTLGSLANALQTDTNATIILNPKIVAQDNQQAHIFSGTNRPFAVATYTQNQTNNTNTQTATNDYRDIGFDMKITPVIGTSEVITLIIDQDFTDQDFPLGIDSDTSTNNNTVNKQTTTTRVHVPNNHFVALSGMLRDTRQRARVGIPCLGGLPVIGAAFANTNRLNQKTNTIIFIRPQIVNTSQQIFDTTDRIEDQFRDQAGALELRYDIDDAIDMVQLEDVDGLID